MISQVSIVTLLMALAFAGTHIFIGRLDFLDRTPRNGWLSFAGGTAVAYVFLHILPELGGHRTAFAEAISVGPELAETLVNSLALLGLSSFYAVERAIKISRGRSRQMGEGDRIESHMLWLHIGSFSLLNVMISYLLSHREDMSPGGLALYFIAMALHFATADFGMRRDHVKAYDAYGRWIIAGAVMLGWMMGMLIELPGIAVGGLFAFVAGGVVLNVMKEELPEDRQSRFWPFAAGAIIYSALVIGETMLVTG